MFIDSSYEVGYYLPTCSKSNTGGVLVYKYAAISPMISSLVLPVPDFPLGYICNTVSNKILVLFYAVVISAFSCSPNASGCGFKGSDLIYSM